MNEVGLPGIPKRWIGTNLEDCVKILDSRRIPVNAKDRENRHGNIPYYGATGRVGWIDDFIFDEELVLLGEDGAPFLDPFKPKAYVIKGKSWVNNHAHVLKAISGITLNSFLCSYLNIFDYHGYVAGTTRLKLNQVPMRGIPFPLPPLSEQHRIVAKIEELFTKLDAGVEALKKVKAQLKRYRQAVLKYAFEGKLTQEWREDNKSKLEPASVLLERIKEERKKNSKGKIKEFPSLDTSDLAELPRGWAWTRLGEISEATGGYAFKSSHFKEEGKYQVIKIGNVKTGLLRLNEKPSYIDNVDSLIISKYGLHYGDLVITLTGTRKKRDYGFIAMIKKESNLLLNQRLAVIRFFKPLYPEYFQYALRSEHFQNNFFRRETGNVGQGNVGMDAIVSETISVPPIKEQQKLVEEIESRFSMADEVEKIAEQTLRQSERLRRSILKTAFEGNLAPQDPTDEPAEKLLERIKAEKAKRELETKGKRKKSKQMELI